MTRQAAPPPAPPPPLLRQDRPQLDADEVRELWSFVHGDIMIGGLRDQLRAHLGLCDRHTWGHAVVEIELWKYGPGPRGGHQPFDVAVLYADLLDEVSQALRTYRPSRRHPAEQLLSRRGTCRICDEIAGDTNNIIGYAAQDTAPLLAEANQMEHTRDWVVSSAHVWQPRACPACQGTSAGHHAATAAVAVVCRRHLLDANRIDVPKARACASHLAGLAARLKRHLGSMTDSGSGSTLDEQTAWMETLGWFAGWELPLTLAGATAPPAPR